MSLATVAFVVLTIFCTKFTAEVGAIPLSALFYPFGTEQGDARLPLGDDILSGKIELRNELRFFGTEQRLAFVNSNGFATFGRAAVDPFRNSPFPLEFNAVAPFYADVDTSGRENGDNGNIYFRQTSDAVLRDRASALIRSKFADDAGFAAEDLLIATWLSVGRFRHEDDQSRNSFQLIVAWNVSKTYAIFLYPDGGISWTKADDRKGDYDDGDLKAQAGFSSEDGRFWTLPGSGTEEVKNLHALTNIGSEGTFLYRLSDDEVVDLREQLQPRTAFLIEQPGGSDRNYDLDEGNEEEGEYYEYNTDLDATSANPAAALPSEDYADEQRQRETSRNAAAERQTAAVDPSPNESSQCAASEHKRCMPPCHWRVDHNNCRQCVCDEEQHHTDSHTPSTILTVTTTEDEHDSDAGETQPRHDDNDGDEAEDEEEEIDNEVEDHEQAQIGDREDAGRQQHSQENFDSHSPSPRTHYDVQVEPSYAPNELGRDAQGAQTPSCDASNGQRTSCHADAVCQRSAEGTGACCRCNPGFYGNGRECVPEGEPQRINGVFGGRINDATIPDTELHTYVVTADGRAYTALSEISAELGQPLTLLNVIGGVMGWLFARVTFANGQNGFALTGGTFNRTAIVHIGAQHTVTITQEFFGKDPSSDYFKARVYVTGTLPHVSPQTEVSISDYTEEYRIAQPGVVKSYSTQRVRVGEADEYQLTIDQTIRYHDCQFIDQDRGQREAVQLRSERTFVIYDSQERIVRYAAAYTIEPLNAEDPCRHGAHACLGEHMLCAADGRSYRCVCSDGYDLVFNNRLDSVGVCTDINECQQGRARCDANADCENLIGGYTCACREPYQGNGYKCTYASNRDACGSAVCSEFAECVGELEHKECVCRAGYHGNGLECRPLDHGGQRCSRHEDCSTYGECFYSDDLREYQCRCRPGFSGDGVNCEREAETCDVARNCDVNADCRYEQTETGPGWICRCKAGYVGNGRDCRDASDATDPRAIPTSNERQHRCDDTEDCHEYGHCAQTEHETHGYCECLPGYKGDGVNQCEIRDECSPRNPSECQDPNAVCRFSERENAYVCVCQDGFVGSGKTCSRSAAQPPSTIYSESCDVAQNCHAYAECLYDNAARRHLCVCTNGYVGDGHHCRPKQGIETGAIEKDATETCVQRPTLCDANADCVPGYNLNYECRCRSGFTGNGQYCRPESDSQNRRVLFAQGMAILQRGLSAEDRGRQVVVVPQQIAVGLAIRSAHIDGSNLTTLELQGLESPEGIAVDWSSRNLYFTDSGTDTVNVASIDGKHQKVLIKNGLVNPRAVALDILAGKLYYSDWNRQKPVIGKASLDGSNLQDFVVNDLALPNGLVVVARHHELCWADAGLQRLECIGLSGIGRRVVFAPLNYPFGLTLVDDEKLLWTDWEDKRIHMVSIHGSGYVSFPASIGGSGKLYGITAVPDHCQEGRTACAANNGDCKFLCLPRDANSRSCACPDNIENTEC